MTLRRSRPILVLLTVAVLASGCGRLEPLSTEEALDRLTVATSRVFDAEGNVIANLHGEINRDIVELEQIPLHVRNAVIAIEDERFWDHQGVDLRSITRAVVSNLRTEPESGSVQGGSTISQQLAKNLYFPRPARNLSRKVAEARVTLQLERQYTKEEILAMYLNTIYLGRGVYGIETAANSYFGKAASALSLDEGAFLAGLIHEPARYEWTPSDPRDRRLARLADAQRRRDSVIDRMLSLDMISDDDANTAEQEKVRVEPPVEQRWKHPYFVDLVLRQLGVLRTQAQALDPRFDFLGSTFEERSRNVYLRGLRIHTTLDPAAQKSAEQAVKVLPAELERLSVAMAAIEPRTGYVRALIGGRDYYPDCDDLPDDQQPPVCKLAKVNLALGNFGGGSGRQPGSSFKPFVLAAALQRGISLHQSFSGAEFVHRYQGSEWRVRNYEGSGAGSMTLVDGTARSVNAVFARLEIEGVGEGDALKGSAFVAETARRMGIGFPTREQLDSRKLCQGVTYGTKDSCLAADDVPAIALGAKEVSPIDMASAYGTFANDGVRTEPTVIVKITDANGRVLYEADPDEGRVLPSGVARGVTYALRRVVQGGTGTAAAIDRPAAGKTGTSQAWRDAWFAGFVPQLVGVVWIGNPIPIPNVGNESMIPSNGYPRRIVGGSYPAMIWKEFMTGALEGVPVREFRGPPQAVFRGDALSSPGPTDPTGLTGPEAEVAPPGTVPSVIGNSFGGASNVLKSAGYDVDRSRGCDPSGQAGLHEVYAQSPGGGSEAPQGSTISIQYQGGSCN
ncbi:MAG: transglycosylase domain-containing protein [Actinomycetota bacterium]